MQARITINGRGAVTLPMAIRQAFGLRAKDELIVEGTAQGILLRPSITVSLETYSDERVAEFARDEEGIGELLPKRQ